MLVVLVRFAGMGKTLEVLVLGERLAVPSSQSGREGCRCHRQNGGQDDNQDLQRVRHEQLRRGFGQLWLHLPSSRAGQIRARGSS